MLVTPARALLSLIGAAFLLLAIAGLVYETFVGLKVDGGMLWWHLGLGLAALFVATRAEHDRTARGAAWAIGFACVVIGIVVGGTRGAAGYSATDTVVWIAAGIILYVGALVRDPREDLPPQRIAG